MNQYLTCPPKPPSVAVLRMFTVRIVPPKNNLSPLGLTLLQGHLFYVKAFVFGYGFFLQSFFNYLFHGYSGYSLLRDPHHNKGLAFTEKERDSHYLLGLLPPAVVTQQLQVYIETPFYDQILRSGINACFLFVLIPRRKN